MKKAASALLCVLLISVALLAADKPKKPARLSPGDKVEVDFGGTTEGEFVEYGPNGWITVKINKNGIEMKPTLPPDKVKVIPKKDKEVKSGGAKKSAGDKMRTWSDKSGKFKVTAKFVELKDGKVTLETDAGKNVELALEKLSDNDQKVAKDLAKEAEENPFQEKEENPFEAGEVNDSDNPRTGGEAKLSQADWSSVETINPEPVDSWSFKPDEAPAFDKTVTSKPIMLVDATGGSKSKGAAAAAQIGFFESIEGVLLDARQGQALVVLHDAAPGKAKSNKIQFVDLVSGKPQKAVEFASDMKPSGLDPTGKFLVAHMDFMFSGRAEPAVGVWKLEDGKIKHFRSWNTVEQGDFFKKEPSLAKFIDSDHIITLSFPNKLTMWQVSKAKAIYKIDIGHGGGVAISPGGKYLAACVKNALYLFDALTGQTLGMIPDQNVMVNSLSFRPDGKLLAAVSNQRLIVWDLEKRAVYRDIYFPQASPHTNADWIGKSHLLIGGERAVDLDKRIVLWQYQHEGGTGAGRSYGELGGQFWYALTSQDRKARGLFHVKLPHDEALKAAASLNADKLLAIRPGVTVSLNINVQGTQTEQLQVQEGLTNQLRLLEMTVGNGSQLVLQATTEAGKTQDITYRPFGGGANQTAKVTDFICRLKFIENGKLIWETSSFTDGSPPVVQIKQGQSLQEALAPYQKPNLQFYSNVKLPQYVARPGDTVAYGASLLTAQGIKPAPNGPAKLGVAGR